MFAEITAKGGVGGREGWSVLEDEVACVCRGRRERVQDLPHINPFCLKGRKTRLYEMKAAIANCNRSRASDMEKCLAIRHEQNAFQTDRCSIYHIIFWGFKQPNI